MCEYFLHQSFFVYLVENFHRSAQVYCICLFFSEMMRHQNQSSIFANQQFNVYGFAEISNAEKQTP